MWKLNNFNNESYAFSENVFPDFELDKIIELGNELVLGDGKAGGRGDEPADLKIRSSKVGWLNANTTTEFIYRRLTDVIIKLNSDFYRYDLEEFEPLQFTEYSFEYNGHYKSHKDSAYTGLLARRKLSFILQLTDPSDYEGGEVWLYPDSIDTKLILPKTKGTITVFPSYTLHEVTPVTKGLRNSLVGWVSGPAFK